MRGCCVAAALVPVTSFGHGMFVAIWAPNPGEPDFALSLRPEGEGASEVVCASQLLRS